MPHFAHHSEENYLKTIYGLGARVKKVNNIALSKALDLNPATVLEMVRKLTAKGLMEVNAEKIIVLTDKGKKRALQTIRKHRLWEVFLVEKLNYSWDEVHSLAEQLEHVESTDLVDRLDAFLGFPASDPHGDPIPDKNGKMKQSQAIPLHSLLPGKSAVVVSFAETHDDFLSYLSKVSVMPGTRLKLKEQNSYDKSFTVVIRQKNIQLSEKIAMNILVQPS